MIVLNAIDTLQSFSVYCRKNDDSGSDYSVELYDEETQKLTELTLTGEGDGDQITFEITHDFQNSRFFTVRIYNSGKTELLNFSKIFITDQTDFLKYDLIKDWYKTVEKTDDGYIVKK